MRPPSIEKGDTGRLGDAQGEPSAPDQLGLEADSLHGTGDVGPIRPMVVRPGAKAVVEEVGIAGQEQRRVELPRQAGARLVVGVIGDDHREARIIDGDASQIDQPQARQVVCGQEIPQIGLVEVPAAGALGHVLRDLIE